jgi:hypothetical protein
MDCREGLYGSLDEREREMRRRERRIGRGEGASRSELSCEWVKEVVALMRHFKRHERDTTKPIKSQTPEVGASLRAVSSRHVRGFVPSSSLIMEMQPGTGQTR